MPARYDPVRRSRMQNRLILVIRDDNSTKLLSGATTPYFFSKQSTYASKIEAACHCHCDSESGEQDRQGHKAEQRTHQNKKRCHELDDDEDPTLQARTNILNKALDQVLELVESSSGVGAVKGGQRAVRSLLLSAEVGQDLLLFTAPRARGRIRRREDGGGRQGGQRQWQEGRHGSACVGARAIPHDGEGGGSDDGSRNDDDGYRDTNPLPSTAWRPRRVLQ